MSHTIAILTGDLVDSTKASASAVEATMALLATCSAEIGQDSRFARFRGDGWQLYLEPPGDCLWACLFILSRLKSEDAPLETRIAVGIGTVHLFDDTNLTTALGSAPTASGRALDAMPKAARLALEGNRVGRFEKRCFAFADDQAARWSREQAQVVALMLSPNGAPTQEDIARRLGITRQAVGARLKAAGYHLLEQAHLDFFAEYSERYAEPHA